MLTPTPDANIRVWFDGAELAYVSFETPMNFEFDLKPGLPR